VPPKSLVADWLHVSPGTAGRLIASGLVETLDDLRALAARPALPPRSNTLVVSLGPLSELAETEMHSDGNWRRYIGWAKGMSADDLALAAAGWWPAGGRPQTLVAVTAGGFVLGAWDVVDVVDVDNRGRLRFELGGRHDELCAHRVDVGPGPICRWLPAPPPD